MEQVTITCTDTGKSVKADVLSRSQRSIRVALVGTNIVMNLYRNAPTGPYVGNHVGMEFTTQG